MAEQNEIIEIVGKWWSVRQVADGLNVSPRTISNWIRSGLLTGCRFGGTWRVSDEALRAFMRRVHGEAEVVRHGAEPTAFASKAAALSREPIDEGVPA